ncbi:helix-turn-helix transcriptional regulator [Paracoccus sp. (in: a-proteobacteria)]|uniref:helix-turn-helix domain-containing protein n=1 Tax=Paracoccus sp. TaxID=267 RepID=UPI00289ED8CC|nr:helix-turn-helix transcriptional regulator [Paracoccus sp. (in: a-proteobacteria)]
MTPRSIAEIGQILRRLRRSKGITQAELGSLAGIRAHHISNIENGVTNPSAATLLALLAALDMDLQFVARDAGSAAQIEDIF